MESRLVLTQSCLLLAPVVLPLKMDIVMPGPFLSFKNKEFYFGS